MAINDTGLFQNGRAGLESGQSLYGKFILTPRLQFPNSLNREGALGECQDKEDKEDKEDTKDEK